MISTIRNPWIRRALIVAVLPFAVAWYALRVYWIASVELWLAVRDEVPEAWKGKAR